jgi:hypothetical protein
MARKKHWLPLLLLLLLAPMVYVLWQGVLRRRPPYNPASSHLSPGESRQSSAPLLPGRQGPVYVPAGEAKLSEYGMRADYVMTGSVLSEEGEALPGAAVSLHPTGLSRITFEWPAALLTQTCDNQGRYTIQLGSPLHAFVVIRAEGYAQKEEEIDFLEPGMLVRDYRLRIAPACVSGYVRTKDGKPVPGAVVVASSGSLRTTLNHSWFSLVTATADKSGRYEIRGIPEGFTVVAAGSATHLAAQEEIDDLKKGNCERISFRLDAGIRIAFVVKNRRGEVIPQGGTAGNGLGEVVFTVPAERGPFEYTVKARGYRDKTIILDPTSPPAEVVLDDGPVLSARVVTATDAPLVGAKVDAGSSGVALTDPMGRFSLNVSSASAIGITVTKPGFIRRRLSFDLSRPALPDEKIVLAESEGGIYGRVAYDDGLPVTRFRMTLSTIREEPRSMMYERDFENNDGVFSITDLPVGTYDLNVDTLPYSRAVSRQSASVKRVEIRKAYYYGEVLVLFPRINEKK